jgi:hypothetical protein
MTLEDEIRIYLPKYLSAENYDTLIKELEDFPKNIDQRMYTSIAEDNLLCQGDIIKDMPYVQMEHLERGVKNTDCIVLSNTCDIDPNNKRQFNSRLMYAPLIELAKYRKFQIEKGNATEQQINDHIKSIKEQRISQILYLPKTNTFNESIVFLDRVINIDSRTIDRMTLKERRLVSLSDYGFYMLLFKISVHFCRLQEKVVRGANYNPNSE